MPLSGQLDLLRSFHVQPHQVLLVRLVLLRVPERDLTEPVGMPLVVEKIIINIIVILEK